MPESFSQRSIKALAVDNMHLFRTDTVLSGQLVTKSTSTHFDQLVPNLWSTHIYPSQLVPVLVNSRPVYIQNMACVVTNEDMCSFGYLSVVHHRMRQTSSTALNERLKQTKNFVHNLIYIISA